MGSTGKSARRWGSMLLGGALIAGWAAAADAAAVYQFTEIDDISGVRLEASPQLANDGTVMYIVSNTNGANDRILTGSGGPIRTVVAEADGTFDALLGAAALAENTGLIAFGAITTSGTLGTFVVDTNGLFTTIALDGQAVFDDTNTNVGNLDLLTCFGRCDIADDGRVAFMGDASGAPLAVMEGSGGQVTVAFQPDGNVLELDGNKLLVTNNVGQNAFVLDINGSTTELLLLSSNDSGQNDRLISTADPSNPFSQILSVDINDNGAMAVIASLDGGGQGVFTIGNTGIIQLIADTTGPFASFGNVAINEFGQVVFDARFDVTNDTGIFTGADPVANRVIGAGDFLFGEAVSFVDLGLDAFNDAGAIAFSALTGTGDGFNKIVRANLGPGLFGLPDSRELLDLFAQMSTTSGEVSMSQVIAAQFGGFDLSFDLQFLTDVGELTVILGGLTLGVFDADDNGLVVIPIDLKALFPNGLPNELLLTFLLNNSLGAVARIDSVMAPGISNGEFEIGLLDDWRIGAAGGFVVAGAFDTPSIPEPGTLGLLVMGVASVAFIAHRRKRGRKMRRALLRH